MEALCKLTCWKFVLKFVCGASCVACCNYLYKLVYGWQALCVGKKVLCSDRVRLFLHIFRLKSHISQAQKFTEMWVEWHKQCIMMKVEVNSCKSDNWGEFHATKHYQHQHSRKRTPQARCLLMSCNFKNRSSLRKMLRNNDISFKYTKARRCSSAARSLSLNQHLHCF